MAVRFGEVRIGSLVQMTISADVIGMISPKPNPCIIGAYINDTNAIGFALDSVLGHELIEDTNMPRSWTDATFRLTVMLKPVVFLGCSRARAWYKERHDDAYVMTRQCRILYVRSDTKFALYTDGSLANQSFDVKVLS